MKKITSNKVAPAVGPYSQAYITGNLLFTSGQLPIDAHGNMPADIQTQTKYSCEAIKAILEEAGIDMNHVVKTTCYLADISLFQEFNAVYATYFTGNPARSCFAVKDLPKGALCEIEAIAEL